MSRPPRSRSSRESWLDEGLSLLSEQGHRALTVDAVCARMQRTKGSFYHHFRDRQAFVVAVLEHWEEGFTRRVIADLEPLVDPADRLRTLGVRTVQELDLGLERTIRFWSDTEPAAAAVLARVDRLREDYLVEQLAALSGDPQQSRLAARARMALLIGTEMLFQDLPRPELRELHRFLDRIELHANPARRERGPAKENP